jgi:D-3-phosphoglycerate dehydrogenase
MAEQQYYVFDFDSTFVQVEALEELAEISLKGSKNREKAIQEIREITDLGIEGKISFTDGLRKRLSIIEANSEHLEKLIRRLRKKVSKSISRNQTFFTANRDKIYVISAGFKEFIVPIVADFGIPADRVFGNTFTFDKKGNINGFDKANLLSQSGGKVKQLEALGLKGEIFVVGDGYTDYQMKFGGEKVKFFAFTENIDRESASSNADHVTPSLDEFLYHNNLPMEISYPKNRIRVLLLENIHAQAEEAMRSEGYQVERLTKALSEDELCEAIKGVSIWESGPKPGSPKRSWPLPTGSPQSVPFASAPTKSTWKQAWSAVWPSSTHLTAIRAASSNLSSARSSCSCAAFPKKTVSRTAASGTKAPTTAMRFAEKPSASLAMAISDRN